MKTRVGVLISGSGTNLQAILDDSRKGGRYEVALVISNREEAYGLERARKAFVTTAVVRHRDYATRDAFEAELTRRLEAAKVELVVLAGFMRVLTKKFVDHFPGRIMNIHPALLPSFPGTGAIEKAWRSGIGVTGVTVHFVDAGVDTGPIILQKEVPIAPGESLEALTEKMHHLEHQLYPEAIRLYAEGRLRLEGERVTIRRDIC